MVHFECIAQGRKAKKNHCIFRESKYPEDLNFKFQADFVM